MAQRTADSLNRHGACPRTTALRAISALAAIAAAVLLVLTPPAQAGQPPQQSWDSAPVVEVSKQVLPPLEHARFCLKHPGQCTPGSTGPVLPRSAAGQLAQLVQVNLSVNRDIIPQADGTVGGRADEWTLNATRGDCEDYVVQKRQRLLEMGWNPGRLRIATALTPSGEGHAVLIARIGGKDVVLDNLTGNIIPWNRTEYRFLKIQSESDPAAWYSVLNRKPAAGGLS